MGKYQMVDAVYQGGNMTPVATVDLDTFERTDAAYPTSRVLTGSSDHGYAQEWYEPGTIIVDGERRPVKAVYLFAASEVADEPEDLPWDLAHIHRVVLAD